MRSAAVPPVRAAAFLIRAVQGVQCYTKWGEALSRPLPADQERKRTVDVLLNSRLGPELLRILVTGSLFVLGMLVGWILGLLRVPGSPAGRARRGCAEVLTMEKILLERRPDGQEIMRIRSCGRDPIDAVFSSRSA